MSTEKQFRSWLSKTENSFSENLDFAIKSWRSMEFSFTKKYEIILDWIAKVGAKQNELPINKLNEVLSLRVQARFISLQIKLNFVEMLIEHAKNSKASTRHFSELLCKLLAVEWIQDLLRSNHDIKAQVYGTLLKCYEKYLIDNVVSQETKLTSQETELFARILNLFKGHIQNATQLEQLVIAYDAHIVQPLTQVFIILRSKYGIDFFEELREIEQSLRNYEAEAIKKLLTEMPTHSALIVLECAVANHRIELNFINILLTCIFPTTENDITQDKELLVKAAYVLEMLRKNNISLNFTINEMSALNFIGEHVYKCTSSLRDIDLNGVLLLLCSALRLNPLILEKHIFELTTWMIVASKSTDDTEKTNLLFEEFLILLLEMFRRLSRAEKFVVNLLKTLNKWLDEHELQKISTTTKKQIKRKNNPEISSPNKRMKTDLETEKYIFSKKEETFQSYMEMIFVEFNKQNQTLKHAKAPATLENSFIQLQTSWPSSSIGYAFSRLITGLVTKASLTIWKTLLYALKDQLINLSKENAALDTENAHFRLDIHAALLCQYFAGAKLIEQYEKYTKEIKQQRELTNEILTIFGKFVLNHNYHKRRVHAFLECCYNATNFELLLAYYQPDGLVDESLSSTELIPHLHAYLTIEEWSSMEEQININGKQHCRALYDRLLLQRIEAQQLLQETTVKNSKKFLKTLGCGDDIAALTKFIAHAPHANWLIEQLNRNQKIQLINFKCQDLKTLNANNFLEHINRNADSLELLVLAIFEQLQIEFKSFCKTSLFAALNCDFDSIRQCNPQNNQDLHKIIKSIVAIIKEHPTVYKIKISDAIKEKLNDVMNILQKLPLGYLRRQMKTLIFVFYLSIYEDLKLAQAEEETKQLFECITDFLHFGQQVPIFRYFDMTKILELLPINDCWDFYKFLFSTIKNEEKGTDEFLKAMYELLHDAFDETKTLNSEQQRLLLIAIDSLANLGGLIARRMNKHLEAFLTIYGNYIYTYFENENRAKKDKKFVEKTLSGFAPFAKSILITTTNNIKINEEKEKEASTNSSKEQRKMIKPLDENFRRICKIYIGYSMDYRNPFAIRLMQVALNHRKLLHLDQDEIELVLTDYWRQLNADMQNKISNVASKDESFQIEETLTPKGVANNLEALMKIIVDNKTNEDLLLTFKEIGNSIKDEQSFLNALEILSLIGKSKFSTIKGAIFNAQFKEITSNIILRLQRKEQRFIQQEVLLKLLHLQQICVDNKSISLTPDALDTIIAFLTEINIKKLSVTDTNSNEFFVLHAAMTSLCTAMVKQRHILLMDRVPQFMHIFKDLLQAIIQYKSERQKDTALEPKELDELAELSLKLEVLMHQIATHSTDVKRVAPFVLIFGINLMVTCKRPTTLYSKIKTHIEAIYYSLIGICDHRVGHFILRCSNEAARQTYELLVKEHKKYHKFKGKV